MAGLRKMRERIVHTEKINAVTAKSVRIRRNHLPVTFFAIEAEDGHAGAAVPSAVRVSGPAISGRRQMVAPLVARR